MTAAPVNTDLACAAADLQHAIHLVGVAGRCGDDPARADVLAEARTLIGCASNRLLAPGVSDPDPVPEPGLQAIAARDLRIGDRFHLGAELWLVRGVERGDCNTVLVVEDVLHPPESPYDSHYGTKHSWPNSRRMQVLTPRPGDDEYALAEAVS